jgi:hypothetical protein
MKTRKLAALVGAAGGRGLGSPAAVGPAATF